MSEADPYDIRQITTIPVRGSPTFREDADEGFDQMVDFSEDAKFFGAAIEPLASAVPGLAAAMGFKGNWSAQAGEVVLPYSVYHSSKFWAAIQPFADVTTQTPGSAPTYWVDVTPAETVKTTLIGTIVPSGSPSQLLFNQADVLKYDEVRLVYAVSRGSSAILSVNLRRTSNTTFNAQAINITATASGSASGIVRIQGLGQDIQLIEPWSSANSILDPSLAGQGVSNPTGHTAGFQNNPGGVDQVRISVSSGTLSNSGYASLFGITRR